MNVRNGSIDAVDISRRIRSFFYSYLFTSLNSIIDLNAKNPDVRFCLMATLSYLYSQLVYATHTLRLWQTCAVRRVVAPCRMAERRGMNAYLEPDQQTVWRRA
jgi:hypothetical protein